MAVLRRKRYFNWYYQLIGQTNYSCSIDVNFTKISAGNFNGMESDYGFPYPQVHADTYPDPTLNSNGHLPYLSTSPGELK